jgi:hypothetical protein
LEVVFYLPNFFYGKEANMQKKILIAIITMVVLGACGFGLYGITNNASVVQSPAQAEDTAITSGIQISPDGKLVAYDGVAGETALATLKKLADVKTDSYSFGELVTSINGLTASNPNESWLFYVNGQSAAVGAGDYNSVAGDKIEWKLESF